MKTQKTQIESFDAVRESIEAMKSGNALLVSGEKGNPMGIGWGTFGMVWAKPFFSVMVRPSRYSFSLLEELGEFTVNFMPDSLKKEVSICGSKSGRDTDKVALTGLHLEPSTHITVPHLAESILHYECRVLYRSKILSSEVDQEILESKYGEGDFHTIFYGEIMGVFKSEYYH